MINLTIDETSVSVPEGTTILEAAKQLEIHIPTLCYHPKVSPIGACRICLVEVDGLDRPAASCEAQVQEGMVVRTNTPEIIEERKKMLSFQLLHHPLDCPVCDKSGECDLQDITFELGVTEQPYACEQPGRPEGSLSPVVEIIRTRCILCGRCVQVCQEVQGAVAVDYVRHDGNATAIGPTEDEGFDCESCGQCITLCPVGTLIDGTFKYRARVWDMEGTETVCPYCSVGCILRLEEWENIIRRAVPSDDSQGINEGNLCAIGRFGIDFVHSPRRLVSPSIKDSGGQHVQAGWDEALRHVAERLKAIKEQHGAKSIAAIGSARCTNEANYVLQRLFRAAIGTSNIDTLSHLSNYSIVEGLNRCFGLPASPNCVDEATGAGLVLLFGTDITESHPVSALQVLKAERCGVPVIAFGYRANKLAKECSQWVRIKPGSDAVVLMALLRHLAEANLIDNEFVTGRTENHETVLKQARALTSDFIEKTTGVPDASLQDIALAFGREEKALVVLSNGGLHDDFDVGRIVAAANLCMAAGKIGREHSGLVVLPDKNNSQGALDMGVCPEYLPGYREVGDTQTRATLEEVYGVPVPQDEGRSIIEIFKGIEEGEIKALYVMGCDLASVERYFPSIAEGLKSLELLVVQDVLSNGLTEMAEVILPACTFAEGEGSFTNGGRLIQRLRGVIEPFAECRPDWQILCELSSHLGHEMGYSSAGDVLEEVARVSPMYSAALSRSDGNAQRWTDGAEDGDKSCLFETSFPGGKARFCEVDLTRPAEEPDEQYPLALVVIRSMHHSGHTSAVSDNLAPLQSNQLEMSRTDAAALKLDSGDRVKIKSQHGETESVVRVSKELVGGVVCVPIYNRDTWAELLPQFDMGQIAAGRSPGPVAVSVSPVA